MRELSLLIKPASSGCNLRCSYCFYRSLAEQRSVASYGLMQETLLEEIVKQALREAKKSVTFAFQGGEPTLVGLDFYKRLVEFEKRYNTGRIAVNYALQTNGMAIDGEWAAFLAKNRFLVGLSLDGPKEMHDLCRRDGQGRGSFSGVMRAAGLLKQYGADFNVLFVVNGYTARHARKIYEFFRRSGFAYLQFIPCMDPLGEPTGQNPWSLTPEKFTVFLKEMFDLWYEDVAKGNGVSIRYFDNLVGMLMGYPPENCGMAGRCCCQFVIEADGGVYPCDFYVNDEWRLGNVTEKSFAELVETETCKRFIGVSEHVSPECAVCRWLTVCRGGCRRSREPFENGLPVLNRYCPSYRAFFEYAAGRLHGLAAAFAARRAAEEERNR